MARVMRSAYERLPHALRRDEHFLGAAARHRCSASARRRRRAPCGAPSPGRGYDSTAALRAAPRAPRGARQVPQHCPPRQGALRGGVSPLALPGRLLCAELGSSSGVAPFQGHIAS